MGTSWVTMGVGTMGGNSRGEQWVGKAGGGGRQAGTAGETTEGGGDRYRLRIAEELAVANRVIIYFGYGLVGKFQVIRE